MTPSSAEPYCAGLGWWAAAAAMSVGVSALHASTEAPPRDPGHARPTLIAESTGVVPGSTVNLAVHFDLDDPWYLYWKGQNDSGLPVSIEWTLPEGATSGELQWPAPQRVVLPGDIIDYIYRSGVTLVVPVQVPASASGTFTAKAHVDYLVCDQVCLPGSADLEIALPVKAPTGDNPPSPAAKVFQAARATMPKAWTELSGTTIAWNASTLTLRVPGATSLAFMPEEQFARLNDPIATGATSADTLNLTFAAPSADAKPHVRGILEVRRSVQTRPDYYLIDLPIAGPSGPSTTTPKP